MSRNDVVMTPLRVKQAIDSRFVKPSEDELNVFINGTWVEFVKKVELPPPVNCAKLRTMYKGDTTLIETPIINATGCTSMIDVFLDCTRLKTVNYIHMPDVTNMHQMFGWCSSLTSVPALYTRNVSSMGRAFIACSSLTTVHALDVSKASSMSNAFYGCSSLTSVTFTGDVVPPYGTNMFADTPIQSGNGYIFVPDDLVDEYKTASGWSAHASVIKGISQKGALQSNINIYNMQIKENPTMFAMTEEEEEKLEMMRELEEDHITGMKK